MIKNIKNKILSPEEIVYAQHEMRKNGIIIITDKSLTQKIFGSILIVYGILTLPIPMVGSIFAIGFGTVLLGVDLQKLNKKFKYEFNLIKLRLQKWYQ